MSQSLMKDLFRQKSLESLSQEPPVDSHGAGKSQGHLARNLTVWDLTGFGIAAVIGAGIFSTVGTAAFHGGPAVVWLFLVTALVCGISASCYAEFAGRAPAAGSAYTYAYVSLGEIVAWIIGWDLIMEYAIGNIAVSISWSGYFSALLDGYGLHLPRYLTMDFVTAWKGFSQVQALLQQGLSEAHALEKVGGAMANAYTAWATAPQLFGGLKLICNLPALGIVLAVTSVAYVGIRESKWSSNAMVFLKVAVILLVIGVGAFYVQPTNWIPFAPHGISGVFSGVSAVFFAYIGFDAISTTAEECRDPQRDLPRAMFLSLGICTLLYACIALVITGIVSYKTLAVGDPLAYVFGPQGANVPWMSAVIALSAVVAMASVMLVFQLGQPRIWMAMSRDGLLPRVFSSVHPKYQTPWFSTLVTGAMVAIPALFMNLTEVTDLTSIGTLFAFILVCSGVVQLHEMRKAELRGESGSQLPARRKAFQLPILPSRVAMPIIMAIASLCLIAYNQADILTYFGGIASGEHHFLSWVEDRDKIPFAIYGLAMLFLVYKCVTRNWSLIPCLGIVTCGYLMTELGWVNWTRFIVWLCLGLVVYFCYGRSRSRLNRQNSHHDKHHQRLPNDRVPLNT